MSNEESIIVTQGDIKRGIKFGTPTRILIEQVTNKINELKRGKPVKQDRAIETWTDLFDEIGKRDRKRQQK